MTKGHHILIAYIPEDPEYVRIVRKWPLMPVFEDIERAAAEHRRVCPTARFYRKDAIRWVMGVELSEE